MRLTDRYFVVNVPGQPIQHSCVCRSRGLDYQVNASVMGDGVGDTCKEATPAFWSKGCQPLPALGSELSAHW